MVVHNGSAFPYLPQFSRHLARGAPQQMLSEHLQKGSEKRGVRWGVERYHRLESKAGDLISRQMHSVVGFNQTLKFNI